MGMFKGIEDAQASAGNGYIKDGMHLFKVVECKGRADGYKGNSFIAVCEVIESTREEYKPGIRRDFVRNITKQRAMALADIKAFLAGVLDMEPEEITEEICDEAVEEDSPVVGQLVKCNAATVDTDGGGKFTRLSWTPNPVS